MPTKKELLKENAHTLYFPKDDWRRLTERAKNIVSPAGKPLRPGGLLRKIFRDFERLNPLK